MMRIFHVVPAAPFGGAQRLAIDLAAQQGREGLKAEVIFTAFDAASTTLAADSAEAAGVSARMICGVPPHVLATLRRVLSDSGLSVIHFHMPPAWMAAAVPVRRSAALVAHLHARPMLVVHRKTLRRRIEDRLIQRLMRRCDRLIAISEWVANAWRGTDPQLAPCVVYNGIPLPQEQGERLQGEGFTLGIASRLSDRKGVEEFLELAAAVRDRAPDIRFLIAGDGPLRANYESRAEALGLGDAMTFDGFIADMAQFWRRLDLAAFTPPFEPFGLRLVEPVAHGSPVVAYATGTGADEVIARCRGVAAVQYGDVRALADKVIELREKPAVRARMVTEGRQDVNQFFSIAAMSAGVGEIYKDALATRESKAKQ